MLDLARRLALADFPDVQVYGDDRLTFTYYVVPPAPAVALDDRGRAECRLLIYVKRGPDGTVATGGNLTVTTTLSVSADRLAAIKQSIETLLTPAPVPDEPPPSAVVVQIANPDWSGGTATVTFAPGVVLTGTPSLLSDNRCAFMAALGTEGAAALRDRWHKGLPGARIVYDMQMRVAVTAGAAAEVRSQDVSAGTSGTATTARTVTVNLSGTAAASQSMTIEGPLVVSGLDRLITEIDLSRSGSACWICRARSTQWTASRCSATTNSRTSRITCPTKSGSS